MTKYNITLYCKNEKSIDHFLKFLKNISKTQNFQIFKKLIKKKKTKKKMSVLKSPHVNKTAQEQFEYTYYFITISFYSWEIKKYLLLFKKIKNQLFPDIHIKIKVKTFYSRKNKIINLNNIIFYKPILTNKNKKQKIKTFNKIFINKNQLNSTILYLKTLDYYGELFFKKNQTIKKFR